MGLALRVALFCGTALLGAAALGAPSQGATFVVSGNLPADTAWTLSGSPYTLEGDVRVPPGIHLEIDAGVTVYAPFAGRIIVEGDLGVRGASGNGVTLAPGPSEGSWGGITVNGTGNATIANATITRPDTGVAVNTTGFVLITDTLIQRVLDEGVSVVGDSGGVVLRDVTIQQGVTALRAFDGRSNVSALRVTFTQMLECVLVTNASNITLSESLIRVCGGAAVNLTLAADFTIESSTVTDYGTAAVVALSADRLRVSGNAINATLPINNKAGVRIIGCALCLIDNNSITANFVNETFVFLEPPMGIHDQSPLAANTLQGNRVLNFHLGILIEDAINPQRILGNLVGAGLATGLELKDSPNQTVADNEITGRNFSFAVNVSSPTTPWYYRQYLTNNTVDGRALLYLIDQAGTVVDLSGVAVVGVVDSQNVTLANGTLAHGVPSALIAGSTDIELRDTRIQSNETGVAVVGSTRVRLTGLTLEGGITCIRFENGRQNSASGVNTSRCIQAVLSRGWEADLVVERLAVTISGHIAFFEGTNLTLLDSTVSGTFDVGATNAQLRYGRTGPAVLERGNPQDVRFVNVLFEAVDVGGEFENTSNITLRNVTVRQATSGLLFKQTAHVLINGSSLSGSVYGIRADDLRDSRVEGSSFEGTGFRGVLCGGCTNVSFVANLFVGNSVGISLSGGSLGLVTRNIFFFNALHSTTDTTAHAWDDGAVGNLWDDYTGLDNDSDGIGDTPYPIGFGLDSDFFPIALFADPVGPSADAGPDIVAYEDQPVLLSGYLSTDDVGIRAYLWSFVDRAVNVTIPGLSTRYWFQTPGTYTVTLTVIDWGGNRDTDTLTVTVLDRTPPHADAGGNRTVDEDRPLALDGTRTLDNDPRFPNGAIFTWYITDRNGSFAVPGAVATWTFATPGNYTVLLYVEDASGFSDTDTAFVVVRDVTPPLVPPLEAPPATEDAPFRVYGSAPSDNDPLWPKGMRTWFELWREGARIDFTNASPAVFNVSEPGPYTVVFLVSDASGNVGSASVLFEVADVTPPDLRAFGDRQGEVGEPIPFDISLSSDNDARFPEGANATWTVTLPGGRAGFAGTSTSYVFATIGDFVVALHLRDRAGNLAETSFSVHIRDSRPPVISVAGPLSVEAGELALFTARASDASDLTEFMWLISGLSTPRYGRDLNYRFFEPGSYQITVHVEDTLGHGANASLTVAVADTRPPTVRVEFTPLLRDGLVNVTLGSLLQAVFLGADSSSAVVVEWSWGDGSNSTGSSASHIFVDVGNYTVRVRASDPWGNANSSTYLVRVVASPPATPPGGNGGDLPTGAAFPTLAVAGLVAAALIGGIALGFRLGRGAKKGGDRPPE